MESMRFKAHAASHGAPRVHAFVSRAKDAPVFVRSGFSEGGATATRGIRGLRALAAYDGAVLAAPSSPSGS